MRASSAPPFSLVLVLALGCGANDVPNDTPDPIVRGEIGPIAAEPQREGDPAAGYDTLVNYPYVTCGLPHIAYEAVFGPTPPALLVSGRTGLNAELPYFFTAHHTDSGVDVIAPNCLICHAGTIAGELVIGLGNASSDYTTNPTGLANLARGLVQDDPAAFAEWRKWYERVRATGPYVTLDTVGVNPADDLAAALAAHRDPETLAWLGEPQLPLPEVLVPVDVPPWWRMAKKNAMFYSGSGRGDHARLMMAASTLCTDTVEEAREIDARFGDVAAYIRSIEPPAWRWEIDAALAAEGRAVFEETCARCHGTYGETETYPSTIVSLDEVGTDPLLATTAAYASDDYIRWFQRSFWGETARFEPADGYVAPPLDGIWATAPYLHNGSVPTIEALLDSTKRPRYWTRTFDTNDYDTAAVGWRYTVLDHGKAEETDAMIRPRIYDTTGPGYGNQGHTFGDALTEPQRIAVIEYLKTL